MRRSVLITGGSGFIGRNLVEALSDTYDVRAPRRQEMDLLNAESVSSYLRQHPVDVLIHSATTPGHRNAAAKFPIFESNLTMFFNLIASRSRFDQFIHLGSGSEYDMRFYQPKMTEDYFGRHIPIDATGFSKYICAKFSASDRRALHLRLFGVFGKYEDYEIRFISNAICKALNGQPITLRQNRKFDYLYIDDLAPVLRYFIDNKSAENVYNVTPDQPVDLLRCAEIVRQVSGQPSLQIQVAESGWGKEYSGNNARLKRVLPDVRWTPIEDAIQQLYSWYSSHRDLIRPEALRVDK